MMAGDSTLKGAHRGVCWGRARGTRGSAQTGRMQGLLPLGCFLLGLELGLVFYLEELILNEVHRKLEFWVLGQLLPGFLPQLQAPL